MPAQRPELIPCLADLEYWGLWPLMQSVSAPLSYVTLKSVLEGFWELWGGTVGDARWDTFVGAYGIRFVDLDFEGEILEVAQALDITEPFWRRYTQPPPNPPDCPCVARYPYPVRTMFPPPPCR